jgi:hypothetical protein
MLQPKHVSVCAWAIVCMCSKYWPLILVRVHASTSLSPLHTEVYTRLYRLCTTKGLLDPLWRGHITAIVPCVPSKIQIRQCLVTKYRNSCWWKRQAIADRIGACSLPAVLIQGSSIKLCFNSHHKGFVACSYTVDVLAKQPLLSRY